jgi:PAS domain S-box-containing protein
MPQSLTDDIGEQLRGEINRLFVRRTRLGLALLFATILLFAPVDLRAGSHQLALLYAVKAIDLSMVMIAYAALGRPSIARHATVLAWLLVATTCAAIALFGILIEESTGVMIMCVSAALISATLFPWGAGPQLAAAAAAATAIGVNFYWVHGGLPPPTTYPAAASALGALAMSVGLSHEMRGYRLGLVRENVERRRAEAQVTTLNENLERRVRERTAELEAATRKLEDEVAERRHTSEALRVSQKQLQDIVDNSTAVIYLKDIEGRYLLVNSWWETLFHVSRAAVFGRTDYDLFPAEAAAAFQANDREVLSTNQPLHVEEVAPHDDGPHSYISVKFPLRDAAGVAYGVCGISTDITDRKQMEAEVRRSESTLSAVIESSGDAIWSIDRDYRLATINSMGRQLFRESYGAEVTLGLAFGQPVPESVQAYWRGLYDRALAGERITVDQAIGGGGVRHFLISLNPVIDAGAVTGLTVFAKDITDLKRAEQRVRQHQAELAHVLRLDTMGELVAGLAHEINQPLGAITNYARGCQRRIQSGTVTFADLGEAVDQIAGEAIRAGEILRRLRRLMRKDSTYHEAIDVNRVVHDAVRVMRSEANLRGTMIRLVTAPHLPPVHGDSIQIEQVVVNLLLNAVEALEPVPSGERDLIVQTSLVDGVAIEVSVHDTGVGLVPALDDKLFDAFFTTKPNGLGMGLAISRSIIEAHHGRLWVTRNPDRGSTFHFILPVDGASAGRACA